ncbi:embryonic ectoderm development protein [Purpureocillium lilacinum]|uniref:Embryonic ectoderm development protein n=1 Tax=Purpureocillium lilacinum TaxID=33203 RepID=A0A179H9H0_PURLI|nr:embryonic ectoderm development protein [Purpureocillium lilacinum]
MATIRDNPFELPKLRVSFGFENDTRFLGFDDNVAGTYLSHQLPSRAHWTIPDLPTEPIVTPLQVHYPHFSTSAVHSGIVDCVAFYGDQILSRACHDNVIVLWRIEGFSSDGPPPAPSTAPTLQNVVPTSNEDPGRLTRSAFVPATSPICPAQYTRLLEFHTPSCGPQFFMRFKLHHVPGQNPVLAFCNAAGNIFFWDLKRLTVYRDIIGTLRDARRDKSKIPQRWK